MNATMMRAPAAARLQTRSARPAFPASLRSRRVAVRPVAFKENDVEANVKNLANQAKNKLGNATDVDTKNPPTAQDVVPDNVREAARGIVKGTSNDDPSAFRAPLLAPAFTRRREISVGRLAIVGFAATLLSEIFMYGHPGPLGQVAQWTGISRGTVELTLVGFLIHGLSAAIPGTVTYSDANQRDVSKRDEVPANGAGNPAQLAGTSPFIGFTKANELWNGRLAMLGFLAACVNELRTGTGPIGQIAQLAFHTEATASWYDNAKVYVLIWSGVLLLGAFVNGALSGNPNDDEKQVY